jgi:predicted DNA-binding transcriptional regulator AlpA
MPLSVDGVTYFSAAEVLRTVNISRVTLWRWRTTRKIPQGNQLRRRLLFSAAEVEAIRSYAQRVEPITRERKEQLRLFGPRT